MRRSLFVLAALLSVWLLAGCGGSKLQTHQAIGGHPLDHRAHFAATSPNLTPNPSFEEASLTGWSSWQGTLARVPLSTAPDGANVAKISQATGTAFSLEWYPATNPTVGTSTNAGAYVAAASATSVGKSITLVIREKSGTTVVAQTSSTTVKLTTAFQHLTVTAPVKSASDHFDIYAYETGAVTGDAFYADVVTFASGATEPPKEEPVALSNTPCTVTLAGASKTGTCTGTFYPPTAPAPEPEPTPTGATVAKAPSGPATPASGWVIPYADSFSAQLGTAAGQDNTWKAEKNDLGCCSNSNEIADVRPSQVSVTSEGLKLTCEYLAVEEVGKHWRCGGVRGAYCCTISGGSEPAGYHTPIIELGKQGGATIVFQAVIKFPPDYGTADPGWWMDGPNWGTTEFDFFEAWGYGSTCTTGWSTCQMGTIWFGSPHPEMDKHGFSPDPSAAFHTYTTEVFPGSTAGKWRYREYIDGQLQSLYSNFNGWKEATVSAEVTPTEAKNDLVLSYALRAANGQEKGFFSGSNSEIVRSAAVYEDGAHAGAGIANGGIAPGTTVK